MKKSIQLSILITLIASSEIGYSQTDSTRTEWVTIGSAYPKTLLHRWSGPKFAQKEKSIGIVPSIQGVNELYLGLGISKAQFTLGEGGGTGFGTTVGIDYNPIDKIIAPKINLWATGFVFILGGNIGISGYYYINDNLSNFVLRPEIGIGYLKLGVNYGYNMFLRNDFEGVSKHTLTLTYYQTFLPFKKKESHL